MTPPPTLTRRTVLRGAAAMAVPALALGPAAVSEAGRIPYLRARRAESLAASVGVNVHLNFLTSAYADTDRVVDAVADLGVRHVRSRVSSLPAVRRGFTALERHRVKVQGVCGAFGDDQTMAEVLTGVVSSYDDPHAVFAAFEGINEPNNDGVPWIDETRAKTRDLHRERAALGLDRIPIVSPALARVTSGGVEGDDTASQAANLGDLSRYVDVGNVHVYPRLKTPGLDVDAFMAWQRQVTGDLPMVCSEGGYFTAMNYVGGAFPTPPDVCAVYLPRMLMENWVRGLRRSYVYELLDDYDPTNADRESNFGLLAVTGPDASAGWVPKPHYRALKNFLAIVGDRGRQVRPTGLRVAVTGVRDLRKVLVAKRDGTRWLLLWRGVSCYDPVSRERLACDARTATLTFTKRRRVTLYRPTVSAAPVHTYARAGSVRIPVAEELLIARID